MLRVAGGFALLLMVACVGTDSGDDTGPSPDSELPPAESLGPLQLLSECPPERADCVVMIVGSSEEAIAVAQRSAESASGHTSFTLSVSGRLGDSNPQQHLLVVTGYTAGMQCSLFGQASAAVVGFSDTGAPTVLTSSGALTLTSDILRIGCADCAELRSQANAPVRSMATFPSWDPSLVQVSWDQIDFDDDGSLFVLQDSRCIRIPIYGSVAPAGSGECSSSTQIGDATISVPGFQLYPGEWLFSSQRSSNLLFLEMGACT